MGTVCAVWHISGGRLLLDAEWITSPTARRILMHWADPRPAWVWSQDGSSLLWRNAAARAFNGKIKKSGPRFAPETVPIPRPGGAA